MNLERFRLTNRVVEATIRELAGGFHKGRPLKRFYRDIRTGRARVFVILREDTDDFVGLLYDATGTRPMFELWLNLENRDEGPPWRASMSQHFASDAYFEYRSPQEPVALARSMGLLDAPP